MKVLITTWGGGKTTLTISKTDVPVASGSQMISLKGVYIAHDEHGVVLMGKNGNPIEFNTAERTGVGFLNKVECTYIVEGYLNP